MRSAAVILLIVLNAPLAGRYFALGNCFIQAESSAQVCNCIQTLTVENNDSDDYSFNATKSSSIKKIDLKYLDFSQLVYTSSLTKNSSVFFHKGEQLICSCYFSIFHPPDWVST